MQISIDRECKYCGTRINQRVFLKENEGEYSIDKYLHKCTVCNRFLKKPTFDEINVAMRNEFGFSNSLDRLLKKIKKLKKERIQLKQYIKELEENVELELNRFEKEIIMLKEQVAFLQNTINDIHFYKKKTKLSELFSETYDWL